MCDRILAACLAAGALFEMLRRMGQKCPERERPSAGTDTISGESLPDSTNDDKAGRQLDKSHNPGIRRIVTRADLSCVDEDLYICHTLLSKGPAYANTRTRQNKVVSHQAELPNICQGVHFAHRFEPRRSI